MLCSVMTADRTYLLDIFYCFYICSCPWVLHELEFVSLKCISPCAEKNKHIQMPGKILTSEVFWAGPRLQLGSRELISLYKCFLCSSLPILNYYVNFNLFGNHITKVFWNRTLGFNSFKINSKCQGMIQVFRHCSVHT